MIKFPRTIFKYHSIVVFWCLALYQALWLCQESFMDTIRSPFLLLTPLLVSCVWRLFVTKSIMKCSLTKAWSISIYHFKAFIFTSPISRLYSVLGSILKLNGWWPNVFLGKKCNLVKSSGRLLKIVSELLCENWFDLVTNFVKNRRQNLLRTTSSLR